jgi:beta-catenin-like protein 1
MASSSSVVEQTLDRLVPGGGVDQTDAFIPSSTWQGPKPGYYFGTSNEGTGYYKDTQQQAAAAAAALTKTKKKKSVHIAEDQNEIKFLLERLEEENRHVVTIDLTPKGLRAATRSLQTLYQTNLRQRSSSSSSSSSKDPNTYMDSELQLYEQLRGLQALAAADPRLYTHLAPLIETLLQLLGHDNTDVCAAVMAVLVEWIDPEVLSETGNDVSSSSSAAMRQLGTTVLRDGWDTMVDNLLRFERDMSEESEDETLRGMENTLSLMENLLELDTVLAPTGGLLTLLDAAGDAGPSVAGFMVRNVTIVSWLLTRIQDDTVAEPQRARCLELLSVLSQNEDVFEVVPNWASLPALPETVSTADPDEPPPKKKAKTTSTEPLDGIEVLIQVIGRYRKQQPANEVQVEMLENACIAMSSCVSFSDPNMTAFLDAQGVQLVVRCWKERTMAGGVGMKLLDFFGESAVSKRGAEELVKAGGLRYIFPLLLGTRIPRPVSATGGTHVSTKEKREWIHMIKEQIVRVFYALTFQLDDQSPEEAKARFLAKFVEDDLKYCDRLVELLLEYDERTRKAEYNFYRSSDVEEETLTEAELELAALDAKLKGGGDIYHRAAAITAYVCVHSKRCHERVLRQLEMKQSGISLIKAALSEFESFLKSDSRQKEYIHDLLDKV